MIVLLSAGVLSAEVTDELVASIGDRSFRFRHIFQSEEGKAFMKVYLIEIKEKKKAIRMTEQLNGSKYGF